MKRPRFKYNEDLYNNGIELNIHIDFTKCKDNPNEMELLQFSVNRGLHCLDYAFTTDKHTLTDLVKEFIED